MSEVGIRLIMEDMGIRDQDRAEEVLHESIEVGEKLWRTMEIGDLHDEGEARLLHKNAIRKVNIPGYY